MRARVVAALTALALLGGSGAAITVAQADTHAGSNASAAQYGTSPKKCKKGKHYSKKKHRCVKKKHHKKHHKTSKKHHKKKKK